MNYTSGLSTRGTMDDALTYTPHQSSLPLLSKVRYYACIHGRVFCTELSLRPQVERHYLPSNTYMYVCVQGMVYTWNAARPVMDEQSQIITRRCEKRKHFLKRKMKEIIPTLISLLFCFQIIYYCLRVDRIECYKANLEFRSHKQPPAFLAKEIGFFYLTYTAWSN